MCANREGHDHKYCNMQRFMEVCLLVLLQDGESHGYSLAERLTEYGFEADELNISTLYRTLRKLEEYGWVMSFWEQGGKGPKRRIYAITDIGRGELDEWIVVLELRRQRIEKLVERYRQAKEQGSGGGL